MKTKLLKYREEHSRNAAKITLLKERNSELEQKIAEMENLEIRAVLRSENVTVDQLLAMFRSMRQGKTPAEPVEHPAMERGSKATDDEDTPTYSAYQTKESEEKTEDEEDGY